MAYAIIPTTKISTKKQWKELNFTPDKEYPAYLHMGHVLILNDVHQPIFIYRNQFRRIRRNRDFLFKFKRRRLE